MPEAIRGPLKTPHRGEKTWRLACHLIGLIQGTLPLGQAVGQVIRVGDQARQRVVGAIVGVRQSQRNGQVVRVIRRHDEIHTPLARLLIHLKRIGIGLPI